MSKTLDHLSVCICTFKRPAMLENLLQHLERQHTSTFFRYSLVVVDNDRERSAMAVVDRFRERSTLPIEYHCESVQNIAKARNTAIQLAGGNFLALIDDDEFPEPTWLNTMYEACKLWGADGVLGPVVPSFTKSPPSWVVAGKFHEKGNHKTGDVLKWRDTRTSNVLLRKDAISKAGVSFDLNFSRGGEDVDFFMRMIDRGSVFVWSNEAVVHETVPPDRCTRAFMLRRALLRGRVTLLYSNFGPAQALKSMIAVPLYSLMLPFTIFLGHYRTMDLLIRLTEHLGLVLALCGIDPIKRR